MRKPHKHANLIKLWADGAEIECLVKPSNTWELREQPIWSVDATYRIKPEPKPDVVAMGIIEWDGNLIGGVAQYNTEFRVSEHYQRDNIKLTFDGETGKLKSAEVL